jgi:hypothetical protein
MKFPVPHTSEVLQSKYDGAGLGSADGNHGLGAGDIVGAIVLSVDADESTLALFNVATPASDAYEEIDESSAPEETAVSSSALTLPSTSSSCYANTQENGRDGGE